MSIYSICIVCITTVYIVYRTIVQLFPLEISAQVFSLAPSLETLDAWELAVRKVYEQHVLRLQKQAAKIGKVVAGSMG